MIEVLRKASSQEFAHHVNLQRNDIARWIADVFHDPKLSSKVHQTTDRFAIIDLVEARLSHAEKVLNTRIEEDDQEAEDRVQEVSHHVNVLEKQLDHMTNSIHHRTKKRNLAETAQNIAEFDTDLLHRDMKRGLAEFAFGIVLGIFIGLILAKIMGLY